MRKERSFVTRTYLEGNLISKSREDLILLSIREAGYVYSGWMQGPAIFGRNVG